MRFLILKNFWKTTKGKILKQNIGIEIAFLENKIKLLKAGDKKILRDVELKYYYRNYRKRKLKGNK